MKGVNRMSRLGHFLGECGALAFMLAVLLVAPTRIQDHLAPEPAAQASPRKAETSPAPIWSKRCTDQRSHVIAHQADGGPWKVECHGKAGGR